MILFEYMAKLEKCVGFSMVIIELQECLFEGKLKGFNLHMRWREWRGVGFYAWKNAMGTFETCLE